MKASSYFITSLQERLGYSKGVRNVEEKQGEPHRWLLKRNGKWTHLQNFIFDVRKSNHGGFYCDILACRRYNEKLSNKNE